MFNPFNVDYAFPEICVILCVCVCAECNGEDTSRDLEENGQEIFWT